MYVIYQDTFGFGISIAQCLGVSFFPDTVYQQVSVTAVSGLRHNDLSDLSNGRRIEVVGLTTILPDL